MNEELQEALDLYGITIEEYMLGCDISDEDFYAKFGDSNKNKACISPIVTCYNQTISNNQ